jgi:hypothetical protein
MVSYLWLSLLWKPQVLCSSCDLTSGPLGGCAFPGSITLLYSLIHLPPPTLSFYQPSVPRILVHSCWVWRGRPEASPFSPMLWSVLGLLTAGPLEWACFEDHPLGLGLIREFPCGPLRRQDLLCTSRLTVYRRWGSVLSALCLFQSGDAPYSSCSLTSTAGG